MEPREEVRAKMAEVLNVSVTHLGDEAVLTDVVTESFVLVEMVIELQESFGFRLTQEDLKEVRRVGELLSVVEKKRAG